MKSIEEIRQENFVWLVRPKKGIKQAELARLMQVSPAQIHQWKTGFRTPETESCRRIEEAANLPPGWMDQDHSALDVDFRVIAPKTPREPASLSGSSPVLAWDNPDSLPEGFRAVPRYRMTFSMGEGRVMFEIQEHEEGDAFRSNWLATKCLKPDSCFVAKVEGTSMEPKLEEGESVLVDRAQTTIIDRKIYAVCYDGQIYCKRLFKAGNEIIMRSDNAAYPEIRAQAEDVEIIGRVVWHAGEL